MQPLIIAVDFDNTLADVPHYPHIVGPVYGAVAGMQALAAQGHRLFIWTCRHGQHLEEAHQWLVEQGIPFERINENCPAAIEQWGETRKLGADIYIDDKNLQGLPNWEIIPLLVKKQVDLIAERERAAQWRHLPALIGLSGKRGSGKNTVATVLQKLMPGWWTETAFANKLKYFVAQMLGPGYDVYTQEGKAQYVEAWEMTVGEVLQKFGTDAVRNHLNPNAWVLACFAGIEKGQRTIITDVRFPNEADAIKARGGIVVRIEGDPLRQRGDGSRNDEHPSETALDDYQGWDWVIRNYHDADPTMPMLRAKVQDMLNAKTPGEVRYAPIADPSCPK